MMQAGMSYGVDDDGNVTSARLMGRADQCLVLKLTEIPPRDIAYPETWCVLSYPHDGDHDFSGGEKR